MKIIRASFQIMNQKLLVIFMVIVAIAAIDAIATAADAAKLPTSLDIVDKNKLGGNKTGKFCHFYRTPYLI